ncbi:Protein of Unknown Function (DUF239) [Quillaja saponaria]|uniref:Neprosin PEP catalytic domain-containing protein n=1 Tax=Quillaja saponaria TaxID=32244 RepID=A0AAD7LHK7_QUISA|nr:Protein of Unknown Function (DUF239) [Quillaja saponaria]
MEMERGKTIRLLLAMALLVLSSRVIKAEAETSHSEIDRKLKQLNKPAVKTIKSEDGDTIDCVDIYKQPAFDHPALKNHTIQMRPSFEIASNSSNAKNESVSHSILPQTWQRSGSCPEGTIPIRRILRKDLLRATSLENFGRKPPAQPSYAGNITGSPNLHSKSINNTEINFGPQVNRSTAILLTEAYSYVGATGDINIWNPNVESQDEYTTAQIWLKAGPGDNFESVEAGWMVNPRLYGDKRTRLFALWTRDSYKSTGCFDLTCTGFVQTSTAVALGAPIEPLSSEGGQQFQLSFGIFLDPNSGNWWLKISKTVPIGYWPPNLFSLLTHSAKLVEWGGEVYSSKIKKAPHTTTAMGSGEFARNLYGNACYIQNVRIMDYSLMLKYPEWVQTYASEEYCYSAYNYIKGYGTEPVFYFGGPGRKPPYCP